jgi:hypothetical protein
MTYYHKALSDGRWGIYHDASDLNLLATIGSEEVCLEVLKRLNPAQPPFQEPGQLPKRRRSHPSPHPWFDQFSDLAG